MVSTGITDRFSPLTHFLNGLTSVFINPNFYASNFIIDLPLVNLSNKQSFSSILVLHANNGNNLVYERIVSRFIETLQHELRHFFDEMVSW